MTHRNVRVVVIGAGPAGLGLAWRLSRRGGFSVTVLERNTTVGGNAGSFSFGGQSVDFGSHRLHPACPVEILDDVRRMLGPDLLDRPRHGRIRLRGKWLHFPLKAGEAMTRLPPSFAGGILTDLIRKPWIRHGSETFADVLERGLGRTICRDFYFPYARKIWGVEPRELDREQARRRVAAASLGKLARKVMGALPGLTPRGKGRFYYPRMGFGRISEAYHQAAADAGAEIKLDTPLGEIIQKDGRVVAVTAGKSGARLRYSACHTFSTIPVPSLVRAFDSRPPDDVIAAADNLRFRAMILVYLELESPRFTEFDAHYFPESTIRITRLSEPKNYSLSNGATTVLCAELPCDPADPVWRMSDERLAKLVKNDLATARIPVTASVRSVTTRRLRQAYPVYQRGFQESFDKLDGWVNSHAGLTTLGRQGLFAHDNTHHTLAMAYAASDCISEEGRFDQQRWAEHRRDFESHVVED